MYLIDHGAALLAARGPVNLRQNADRLPIREEFANELREFDHFCEWYDRILRIPAHFIEATVREAAKVGVDEAHAREVGSLLISRRSSLCQLFRRHKSQFPNVIESLFTPFTCDDDPVEYCI